MAVARLLAVAMRRNTEVHVMAMPAELSTAQEFRDYLLIPTDLGIDIKKRTQFTWHRLK